MLLALSGLARSGKDSTAEVLVKNFGFVRIAFADQLKNIVSEAFNVPLEILHGPEKDKVIDYVFQADHLTNLVSSLKAKGIEVNSQKETDILNAFVGQSCKTYRNILQIVGSNICREMINQDIWIKLVYNQIKDRSHSYVITDARMPNERKMIKELGGYLGLVKRPGYIDPSIDYSHPSESSIGNDEDYDLIFLNNGTLVGFQNDIAFWYHIRGGKQK